MDLFPDTQLDRRVSCSTEACAVSTQVAFERLHALEQAGADGREILLHAIRDVLPGRIATVSSFGAESVVLLSLIAEIDPSLPVIFLETGKHFPETLAYRDELTARLGLTDVRSVAPRMQAVVDQDPTGELWYFDSDACCTLRKVQPLDRALAPFDAWISGRKRFQSATRTALPFVERDGDRIKLNPIADWDGAQVQAEMKLRGLPAHPLVERGFASIGCAVCTRSVAAGEDARSGRWAGLSKVECGIHRASAGG
ncbi:MAG: phosphoadenylyl-sulfate reductase [Janthinobacterium lividum]